MLAVLQRLRVDVETFGDSTRAFDVNGEGT
jgi:hypothetical protein